MVNIYTAPGSKTEERHALNNTRAEMQAGLGPCQIGVETDQLKLGFKDHLGNYHSCGDAGDSFKVKLNHDTTEGYLEDILVPAAGGAVSLSGVGDTMEADVGVDNATIEKNAGALRVKDEGITDAKVATANKDGTAGTYSMRSIGTGALQACSGADARLSDARAPTAHASTHNAGGGDALAIDAAAGTGSFRTLGTGALQACAGNDGRLSDSRAPTAHKATHEPGGSDAMDVGAAANVGSLRKIGTGALEACAGNDSRLSDARTPIAHASTHNAGGGDALAIDSAAGTGSLRTLGTASTSACAGNDPRLSDARTPVAHDIAGALHNASTKAQLDAKVSDADLISNLGGEFALFTEKIVPLGVDKFPMESTVDSNAKRYSQLANICCALPLLRFASAQLQSPNNADWVVNALASATPDSLNNALVIRRFDDTTEQGVGFMLKIPANAIGITFSFHSRAQTAPGGAAQIVPALYSRQMANNVAVGGWGARLSMTAIDIPTNAYFQYDSQSITLATLGLTAGNIVQFELTRYGAHASDNLSGYWNLLELDIKFY